MLVTGFEPFGGSAMNPSREAIPPLESHAIPGVDLRTALLPVIGGHGPDAAPAHLARAIATHAPEILVCVGETGSRGSICLERVARNRRHYRIADNAGAVVLDQPVIFGAPPTLPSTLPLDMLHAAMASTGAPIEHSIDAGAFLCNEIMFHALHLAPRCGIRAAGFIHVPRMPEQLEPASGRPSLALDRTVAALRAALTALAAPRAANA